MQLNLIKNISRNVKSIVPSVGSKSPSNYPKIDHKFNRLMTRDLRLRKLLLIRFKNILNNSLVNNNISNDMSRRLVSTTSSAPCSSCLPPIRNYSSKTGNPSSESDSELYDDDEDLFHEPPKVRYGLLKVALTIILGTYAGALFAMFGANFLEEFEIFVKEDDDEDD